MGQLPNGVVPSKPRLIGLDLLRLLAVVLVLGRHMPYPPASWPIVGRLPFLIWIRGGWVGVDLFFVLSGFLVSGLLFTEYQQRGHLGVGRFFMRRGWKIYPPFFLLIAVTIAVILLRGQSLSLTSLASELFFVQSYVPGLWNHTWSLAVEEHFYVLLPVALTLILWWNRGSPTPLRPVLRLALIVAIASLAARVMNWCLRDSYHPYTHLFATHLRLDSLLFGVAIAYVYHFHSSRFARLFTPMRRSLILGGAALLLPAFVMRLESPFIATAGYTIFYIGSGMMLIGILLSQIPLHRPVTLLATLGAYSYSIYLWHMPVLFWGLPLIESILGQSLHFSTQFLAYFVGSFSLGILMAKLVELPVLRLRDRWFPSRSPGAVEVVSNDAEHLLPTVGHPESDQRSLPLSQKSGICISAPAEA